MDVTRNVELQQVDLGGEVRADDADQDHVE